ncbi:MAG: YybH family protein [Desulfomonilaceae bacterium]
MSRPVIIFLVLASCVMSIALADNRLSNDEAAIRQTLDSYVEAFNNNDSFALSNLWSEDAEYEDETGEIYRGRKEIQEAFKQFFSENRGVRLKISVEKINKVSSGVAVVAGKSSVSAPGEEADDSEFVSQFIKKDNQWQIAKVGEGLDSPNYQRLKDLEWLIGEWTDEKNAGQMQTIAQWTANKNFITVSFAIQTNEIDVEGTQIIGWDPVNKTIKSWIFDSLGSVAEGVWSKQGSRWQVKVSRIFNDGAKGSETYIYEPDNKNTFVWSATARVDNGQQLPDIDVIKIVRKQSEKD